MEVTIHLQRAHLLLQQGRVTDAMREVKNALSQEPENTDALALLTRCYYEQGKYKEGLDAVHKAIAADPSDSYSYYLKAFGHYRLDESPKAMHYLQQALQLAPYNADYFGLLAMVYLDQKKFPLALEQADQGLSNDPENITCLNARAMALNKMSKTEEAIETMQNALSQDPDNAYTHSTVGWNYLEKGKHKEARHHFREALRIQPTHIGSRDGLKEALKSQIPPYRWLLQYSFWINNKGKQARWIFPIGLYLTVRVAAGILNNSETTEVLGGVIIGIYLLFVVTTWIINPIANFFLLFHKDGKYAVTLTEKWTAITVVSCLCGGAFLLVLASFTENKDWSAKLILAALSCWFAAVPLGDLEYPLSWKGEVMRQKTAMVLVALATLTFLFSFAYLPAAIFTGGAFMILFVLNNWLGVFRR